MKPFIALMQLSFKSLLLTTVNLGRGKKRAVSGVAAFILLCVLMLFISSSYAFSMGFAFSMLGAIEAMLLMMCIMAIIFPFVFVVFAAQSLVFSTKDVDLVLSLPLSSFKVMLARVLALYLEALVMCELLLLPGGVAYLVFGGSGGAGFILAMLAIGLPMALIPTTLALAVGALVSLVISRLRFKNLLNVVFSLLLVLLILVFSFSFSFTMSRLETESLDAAALYSQMAGVMPPANWAVLAMTGQPLWLLPFLASTVLPFLGVTWLFSRFYKKILTQLGSHKMRSDYKLGTLRATGSFAALYGKEARRFFGTPAYVLNAGIGYLMMIIASVAAVVKRGDILALFAQVEAMGDGGIIASLLSPLLLAGVVMFLSMGMISCASISLEGRALWILKEAPLGTGTIFGAKAGFGATPGVVSTLVCVPLIGWAVALPPADVLLILLVGVLFSVLDALLGLFVNLLFPRLDADNETVVIKNSASVLVTLLVSFVLLGLFIGLYFLLAFAGLGFKAICGVVSALLAGLCGLLLALLLTKGKKLFAAL